MCGIVGFLGYIYGYTMAIHGIKMLLNRGYDSSGICSINKKGKYIVHKYASTDKINAINLLENHADEHKHSQNVILHTRWATTGPKNDVNSHPHLDYKNRIALVHNGIIENYLDLRKELIGYGIPFRSQTDSEVIVNLISYYYDKDKPKSIGPAIRKTLDRLEGTWGLVITTTLEPNKMYCARHGSPLLIGFSEKFLMVASEQSGFGKFVDNYICLNNRDIVVLEKKNGKVLFKKRNEYLLRQVSVENFDLSPRPYPHWTLKEIYEQPDAAIRAMGMGGRLKNDHCVKLGGLESHYNELINIDHLIILGCGTSYHAGLYTLQIFKEISGFNTVQIFDGGNFTKYDIPKKGSTALLLLSQSGETKDLHRCVELTKDLDIFTIGVINVVDSLIARDVNCGVYLNAGREVGVASTKSFTSQVIVLYLIAIWFAQIRNLNLKKRQELIQDLRKLPTNIKHTLQNCKKNCIQLADYLSKHEHLFLLGRGNNEAIAKEGALKIKEISCINSNGYNSASLKHGPYAILQKGTPVIILIPDDAYFTKNCSVINELLARYAYVVSISDIYNGNEINGINIPENKTFSGILCNVVLQNIAYYTALKKGTCIDKPIGLAKCVSTD